MIIDYSTREFKEFPNFKGGEKSLSAVMDFDGSVRILNAVLVPGASIGEHTHEDNCEVIYFLAGSGKAVCNGVEERVSAGMCHYCPKGATHTLINDGTEDLRFFACVPQQ